MRPPSSVPLSVLKVSTWAGSNFWPSDSPSMTPFWNLISIAFALLARCRILLKFSEGWRAISPPRMIRVQAMLLLPRLDSDDALGLRLRLRLRLGYRLRLRLSLRFGSLLGSRFLRVPLDHCVDVLDMCIGDRGWGSLLPHIRLVGLGNEADACRRRRVTVLIDSAQQPLGDEAGESQYSLGVVVRE